MIAYARRLALLLVAGIALAQDAAAESVADTLSRWGLIGTWSVDCTRSASTSNGHLTYIAVGGGKVMHERDFGDRRDANEVQQASTGIGGALDIIVHFPTLGQTRKYTLLMGVDGRVRAMSNSRVDGTAATIRDGKFTEGGGPTPWQMRCR